MTEGAEHTPAPLTPLLQLWLDDVSGLLTQVNELGAELQLKESYVSPEEIAESYITPDVAEDLKSQIETLRQELAGKTAELVRQQTAERILRDSVQELQDEVAGHIAEKKNLSDELATAITKRDEAIAQAIRVREECDAELDAQVRDFEERERARDLIVANAQSAARTLRVELAKEQAEGQRKAEEKLRAEHLRDIAKNHQIGKDKGIAIATAYIEAANEENADLARSSLLASSVVIQSAQRIEAGLTVTDVEIGAGTGSKGSIQDAPQAITLKNDESEETEEKSLAIFSRFRVK